MESSEQKVYYKNLDTAEYRQKSIVLTLLEYFIFLVSGGLLLLFTDSWVVAIYALIITVIIVWFLYRIKPSWFIVEWHTSSDGLDRKILFSRKHLAWSDVTTARLAGINQNDSLNFELKIDRKWIRLEWMPSYFIVSVWQHLERQGKTKEIIIPKDFQRYLQSLPDDLYSEIEWYNPYPPNIAATTLISAIGIILPIGACLYYGLKSVVDRFWLVLIAGIFTSSFAKYFWYRYHIARRMWLFPDRLQTESARGQITFFWDKVTNARILKDKLIIWESWSKLIVIPFDDEDKDSIKFIYSVINRLRSIQQPVLVPVPVYVNDEDEPM